MSRSIKVSKDIFRDHKVILMANILMNDGEFSREVEREMGAEMCITSNLIRHCVVGGLLSFWGSIPINDFTYPPFYLKAREDVLDLIIDEIVGIPNFGNAMRKVGFLRKQSDDKYEIVGMDG